MRVYEVGRVSRHSIIIHKHKIINFGASMRSCESVRVRASPCGSVWVRAGPCGSVRSVQSILRLGAIKRDLAKYKIYM